MMALAVVAATIGVAGHAQESGPFGGFKHDRSAPIEITSDSLEVRQAEELAIFTGDVVAGQGTLRLTSDVLYVYYDENPKPVDGEGADAATADDGTGAADDGTGAIRNMRAEGNVFLSNGTETAQGEWGEYDVETGMMLMGGDVVLTQGGNAISGPSLTINLDTGVGRVDGGRVTSIFKPKPKSDAGSGGSGATETGN